MRRLAPLVVVAVVLPLAGAAAAAGDPKQPQQRHTAADTRLARDVALRRGDLAAGWTAAKPASAGPPCTAEPDESRLVQTAKVDPTFAYRDGVTSIGSEVDVFRTAAQARTDWRLSTLHLLAACLLQQASTGLQKGVRVSLASAQRLALPQLAERAVHFRFAFVVRSQRSVKLVTDVVALGRGRVTVVLHALSVARPLPDADLRALAEVIAARLDGGGAAA